jgi:hypothetical protein
VLRHPLSSAAWIQQDNLGPAAVVPTVIRDAQARKWNTSTHVVKEFGGYNGLSSFVLVPDGAYECDFDFKYRKEELARSRKLVFTRRPDVAAQYVQRDFGLEEMRHDLSSAPIPAEDIDAAREGASFVSLHDATEGWKFSVYQDSAEKLDIAKNMSMVHPCPLKDNSCFGHAELSIPFAIRSDRMVKNIIKSIVHCPRLYWLYMEHAKATANPILKCLHYLLKNIHKSQSVIQSGFAKLVAALRHGGLLKFKIV